ncbi:MAG: molecular chaperone HscC [Lachnospiraceae bacterium]|nr:molecular chaperone HscC [Lachnospiraceae bacterium]
MVIGIDLGTTNSLVAYYTEEGPKIIPNRLGERLTPSIVSLDENDQLYIGRTAEERMQLYPETCASVFKRDMGSNKAFELGSKSFTAEELSSFVLRSLKEDAEEFLGEEVTEAVISVPAYFNDMRRKATKRAGELAGLKVDRIISEPTAAAIAYGLYNTDGRSKFLIFDLGGGTFDVSILDYFEPILEVRAVAGDNFLGGEDFTTVIENIFFERNKEIDKDSLSLKEKRHIHKQAEKLKINFGDGLMSSMTVTLNDKSYDMELTLHDYEKACEELYDRIRIPVKKSLADANLKLSEIDRIVLVGGATKLPGVRRFVAKMFKNMPDTSVNPDEAVALGAAIQAAIKERDASIKEVILTDVCPFTLGTEVVVDLGDNRYEDDHYCPIIERNTIIPVSRTERMYTIRDNQTKLDVTILQGESRFARNNVELGRLEVSVPKNSAGKEAIDVTYTYDINSILEVEVTVISTGQKFRQIVKNNETDMTDEQIEERFKELSYLKIHPRDQEENKLLLLRGEKLYSESLGMDRQDIDQKLKKFEIALQTQDKRIIEKERKELKEYLDAWDDKY